jgi:hypothetical protein
MKSKSKHGWRWIVAGGVVVLLVICVVWALRSHGGAASHRRAVAVKAKAKNPHPGSTNLTLTRPAATLSRPTVEGQWEKYPEPGLYVMALARDGDGNVWVGTEGNGVWQFNPDESTNGAWRQFTVTNGLGDNYAYSLAVDQQGRVWAGHLNHGVSVYNGERWTNYDVPFGPIGERIFKIAVCPVDGDVWMGTSAGLTRYSVSKDTWTHFVKESEVRSQKSEEGKAESGNENHLTPALSPGGGEGEGLPGNQISAIAFDAKGNIYVGTQCDGIAMASRESDYTDWRQAPMTENPFIYASYGLPSKLINDLLAASDGTIYAATDGGLAWTRDGGTNWTFRRGMDLPDKMKGLAGGPPKGWSAGSLPKDLPPEDYVTCLAEDEEGVMWADFRRHGLLALSDYSYKKLDELSIKETEGADYGRAILPMPDFKPWLASYGKGLLRSAEVRRLQQRQSHRIRVPDLATNAPFPSPARVPDLAELNGLLKEVETVPTARLTNGAVIALEDDWRTQGQWKGRYGRFWIVLCANWSPYSDEWGGGWEVAYEARLGPNHAPGDLLRNWVQWLATADNRCLEMSPIYLHSRVVKNLTTWDKDRRESEWDDHGEAYPMSKDGPHILCSLLIPNGLFYLSLYEVDPNGHSNANRFRDYQISVRPHPGRESLDEHYGNVTILNSFHDLVGFDQKPELAHARVNDFYGGVYKRFLVRGPTKLTFQVNRNYSFNTILSGVMLDLVDELPPPYYCTRQEWEAAQQRKEALGKTPAVFVPAGNAAEAAQRLAQALAEMPFKNEAWWAENKRRIYLPLLRWQLAETNRDDSLALASSYYQLNRFSDWEGWLQEQDVVIAREIEQAIRWDGVMQSYTGMGNQIISDYVQAHPE